MSLDHGTVDQWASEAFRERAARDLSAGLELVKKAIECLPLEHPHRQGLIRRYVELRTIWGEILNEKSKTQY